MLFMAPNIGLSRAGPERAQKQKLGLAGIGPLAAPFSADGSFGRRGLSFVSPWRLRFPFCVPRPVRVAETRPIDNVLALPGITATYINRAVYVAVDKEVIKIHHFASRRLNVSCDATQGTPMFSRDDILTEFQPIPLSHPLRLMMPFLSIAENFNWNYRFGGHSSATNRNRCNHNVA